MYNFSLVVAIVTSLLLIYWGVNSVLSPFLSSPAQSLSHTHTLLVFPYPLHQGLLQKGPAYLTLSSPDLNHHKDGNLELLCVLGLFGAWGFSGVF